MAGEWEDLTLGDMGRVVTGKTPLTAVEGNFGGRIPFVTPSDMDGRKTISTTARFLTQAGAASVKGSVIPAGSIMVSCIGSDMGKVVVAGCECVTNQQINSIVVDERYSSEFVYYSLSTRKDEIRHQAAGGSAVPILNKGDFSRMEITLPPLADQKSIAAVLGALDDKIDLNRRMNATLEAMARALFQSWFVDFDPVRARLDGRPPEGMNAETAALFPDSFQDTEAGHIPQGWAAARMPDAIEINPRRTLKKGIEAPYLDMKNLPTQGHSANEVIERIFTSGTKFQNGDTLLARITPCLENGKTGYVDFLEEGQVGWGSTEYIVLSPKSPLPPQFGYLLARSDGLRTHAIQNMTGTSGRQRVPVECFDSYWLAIPPSEIAHRFDELTAPMMAKIKANSDESRTLATLRDSLLPKLLSGELRTPIAPE